MNKASEWRVELAGELSEPYLSHGSVRMVCLGGSAARGISDDYSDLDIIVYWDVMDGEFIESCPLERSFGLERTALLSQHPGTFIESYHIKGLKVDFGHSTLAQWEEWVAPLLEERSSEPELLSMVGGYLASIPFKGREIFSHWKERLEEYPDELAKKVIGKNMGIYVKGYLLHQCLERGDHLAWQDGMCSMLKKILNITAAINGLYYSADEPRWVDYQLGRMSVRAEGLTGGNIAWMLENPGAASEDMLYRVLDDTLGLVAGRFPEFTEKVAGKRERLASFEVKACRERPETG
ncbi:MAG: DUF4037 domain-containing protein [Candidatus Fermentibacteraceae bacterium]|nr:DUF4037 domain-containing protein [Candidatus Fermentibacteraceae bacterium]MBN2609365.1 DUF4037 domain-containing protein [Candidatus Fermentibacteraceae bacterium]